MIDPREITDFSRTSEELEELWIFCVCVPGKNAMTTARGVDSMLNDPFLPTEVKKRTPLQRIAFLIVLDRLKDALKRNGLGQYNRIERVLSETISRGYDLKTVSVSELESLPGVGPKTSRFFIVHSRPNQKYAILDTHLLKFLKDNGIEVPKSLSAKKYLELEQEFIRLAGDEDIAELDLKIWRQYSGH
ncbi:hypothetical protein GOV11_01640 [Candidatus Woesearchaeota archaeon]|nr:hypothetical protein [Candidatus Woesearchaeota archaeon]